MIVLTGDTHGGIDAAKLVQISDANVLGAGDTLIILGDFGFVWDCTMSDTERGWYEWLDSRPFETLFIDGNHENHKRLMSCPVEDYAGGKVHRISHKVRHLMRGELFTLEGHTFFVMGGASSTDKFMRMEDVSWWAEELPSAMEIAHGADNLDKVNYNVDYVLTHCAGDRVVSKLCPDYMWPDDLTAFFDALESRLTFKHWYFGHYHMDADVEDKFTCLFQTWRAL